MNDQVMTKPTMKVAVASKDNANYVAGRRAFFKYRDLGVTEGTGGFMRAQVTSAEQGMSKPTGWHVHKCQAQFVYVLSGTVRMQVQGSAVVTLKAGETFYEGPDDVHTVSANASNTEPAKILVFMVKDKSAPATTPAKSQ